MLYEDKNFIGLVIKKARKRANLTQAQLSEKICMSEKNIVNIENGKQFPTLMTFLRIIETLNISLEEFGINLTMKEIDINQQRLIQSILTANPNEIKNYIDLLNVLKNANK